VKEIKNLLQGLREINIKAQAMSKENSEKNTPLYFEIEFSRKHVEDAITSLEKSYERQSRKSRAA